MVATAPAAPPAGLLLAEDVLFRLREVARDTPLWTDSRLNSNEMLERGASFASLKLDRDCTLDSKYLRFLAKHWSAAAGDRSDPTGYFVARSAEPRSLRLVTQARLAYLRALPAMAKALDGLPVSLGQAKSWTWDHSCLTAAGRPTYRTLYQLTIDLQSVVPFKAAAWLSRASSDICASEDPRADRCLFQQLEDAKVSTGGSLSVATTRDGYDISCLTQAIADNIRDTLFSDCETRYLPRQSKKGLLVLRVTLPVAAPAA